MKVAVLFFQTIADSQTLCLFPDLDSLPIVFGGEPKDWRRIGRPESRVWTGNNGVVFGTACKTIKSRDLRALALE